MWWSDSGAETQETIFKHLRTINMAEIPARPAVLAEARAASQAAAHMPNGRDHAGHDHRDHDGDGHGAPGRFDLVLFRHADPNVMAMLLPLLDFAQVSRLFGEATGIVVDSPDAGGVRTYARPADLPERPRGWLRIRVEQYDKLGWFYQAALRKRAVDEFCAAFDRGDGSSPDRVLDAFERAEGYKLTEKGQIWSFIRLDLILGARFEFTREYNHLRDEFAAEGRTADVKLLCAYRLAGKALGRRIAP